MLPLFSNIHLIIHETQAHFHNFIRQCCTIYVCMYIYRHIYFSEKQLFCFCLVLNFPLPLFLIRTLTGTALYPWSLMLMTFYNHFHIFSCSCIFIKITERHTYEPVCFLFSVSCFYPTQQYLWKSCKTTDIIIVYLLLCLTYFMVWGTMIWYGPPFSYDSIHSDYRF